MTGRRSGRNIHGFSLIEMAVVIVIVGMMVAMMMQGQGASQGSGVSTSATNNGSGGCYAQTQQQLVQIRAAIDRFVRVNQRYPMPTGRNFGIASPNYGQETVSANVDGVWMGSNQGLYGSLPFMALGLPQSFATDCWGDQFTYFVMTGLTTTASNYPTTPPSGFLNPTMVGMMTVYTGTFAAPITLTTSAAWAVISHGETGPNYNGGVSKNYTGSGHSWCWGTASIMDHYNCNLGSTLAAADFNSGSNAGANFFDDLIIFGPRAGLDCDAATQATTWTVSGKTCSDGLFYGPVSNGSTQVVTDSTTTSVGTATFMCVNGTPLKQTTPAPTCVTSTASCGTGNLGTTATAPSGAAVLCAGGATASGVVLSGGRYFWTCTASSNVTPCMSFYAMEACGGTSGACAVGSPSSVTTVNGWGLSNCTTADSSTTNQVDCWTCTGTDATKTMCEVNHGSKPCAPARLNWSSCTGDFNQAVSGGSSTGTNINSGHSGTATSTCTNGIWATPTGTCS